jgi:uncharacterized protein YcnI
VTRRRRPGTLLAAGLTALVFTVLSAAPALAHVEISPEQVAPNTFGTFTIQVPNEHATEDTVGLDVSLPDGFLLESAEQVPGWKATVDTRPDGTPVAVHWKGGHIPPHTFGQFSITGRVSKQPGPLSFPAVQHYETSTESWNGSESSEHPAPTLVVSRSAATPTSGSGKVPKAFATTAPRQDQAGGTDALARSRADLALMLALAALVAMVGLAVLTLLRRRPAAEGVPDPPQRAGDAKDAAKASRAPKKGRPGR